MTKAQWAALPRDCKAVRSVEKQKTTGHTATAAQWTIISVGECVYHRHENHGNSTEIRYIPRENPRGMTEIMTCTVS